MKRNPTAAITAITLLALAIPFRLAGRERENRQQPRYKLIDLGTFGGPNSGVPTVFYEINKTAGARAISNQRTVAGTADTADTSTVDPICSQRGWRNQVASEVVRNWFAAQRL